MGRFIISAMAGDGKLPFATIPSTVSGTTTTVARTTTMMTTSTTPTTTTTTTSRRAGRFASSRSTTRSFNVERPPIILEIGSTVWRVGYAEQVHPQHLIRMDDPIFDTTIIAQTTSSSNSSNISTGSSTKTELEWYITISPLIEQVYDRLMCKPSTRRVVCLYHQPYIPRAFQRALDQHLWNRDVPALVRYDSLQLGPMVALGLRRGLIVQVSREDTMCVCHADGYVIPYTYQIVPIGYKDLMVVKSSSVGNTKSTYVIPSQAVVSTKMNELLLKEYDPNSLVVAILSCIKECPLDLRAQIVSNIVFYGDGVALLPDLPRLVVNRVQQILEGTTTTSSVSEEELQGMDPSTSSTMTTTTPESSSEGGTGSTRNVLTRVPINTDRLRPLASKITLVSCEPYRPDWIAWVGASLWAATWNRYDDDETPIPWVVNANTNASVINKT